MTSVRKFQFDESFDVDSHHGHGHGSAQNHGYVEEMLAPEPPPPTFGEAELAAAREAGFREGMVTGNTAGREQGYAEGHTAGLIAGAEATRAEVEGTDAALTARALEQIAQGVANLIAEREASNAARSDQPVHIALAIVRKLMPALARRNGLEEVEALVRTCLTDLIDEPRLIVRVAADTIELVREHLEATVANCGFGTKLVVLGDPDLGPGDCRVEWAEGGSERDTARLLADIEESASRLLDAGALQ
jgi:flagellar assembly protein FliH